MAIGKKAEYDWGRRAGTIESDGEVFEVTRQDIVDFYAFERGRQLDFRIAEGKPSETGRQIAYDVIAARYGLPDLARVVQHEALYQRVQPQLDVIADDALRKNSLNTVFARNYGTFLGFQFARELSEKSVQQPRLRLVPSSYFDPLRELVVIIPTARLVYRDELDVAKDRLKFQLALWLGDYRNKPELRNIADALEMIIQKITKQEELEMYSNFLQTMIAKFKQQVGE